MTPVPTGVGASPTLNEQLDHACDRFESEWKAGRGPSIEQALADAPSCLRGVLLRELLRVELAYVQRRDGRIDRAAYRARFATELDWVRDLLGDDPAVVASAEDTSTTVDVRTDAATRVDRSPDGLAYDRERFRPIGLHARGGLGEVLVALDAQLNRRVALKRIQPSHADDLGSRSRFLLEAEITGALEHPGVVPVYGLGVDAGGRPYYAMRFIQGEELGTAVRRFHATDNGASRAAGLPYWSNPQASRPSPKTANSPGVGTGQSSLVFRGLLRRFLDACNAVAYAHSRGVLHRDLKPANIMLGPYGETLVVDWGLAKLLAPDGTSGEGPALRPASGDGSGLTVVGSAVGTPAFMSPEQAEGRGDVGPASDVYSLGATLYFLLAGKPAFQGPTREVLAQVALGDFPPPSRVNPRVPRALEAVCLRAMSLRPGDRYSDPRTLADDLERWLADEPVTAYREPLSSRARRWARHHRTTVAAAAVALFAGLAGLGVLAAQQSRANAALLVANGETNAALTRSEESRRQAQAVGDFLVDALRKPDPELDGKDVKVADVLDQALARLDQGFDGSKETEGALLDALGRSYAGLGLDEKAELAHRKAHAVREKSLGTSHRDTLSSALGHAQAVWELGRRPEALASLEDTLRLQREALGVHDPDTLDTWESLGAYYAQSGRTDEAIAIHREVIAARESALGPDHLDTLVSRNDLGLAYEAAGRFDEAVAQHEAVLKAREAKLGPDHPDTLASRHNLANAYNFAGRSAEAVVQHEVALKGREARLAPDHPAILASRHNLAIALSLAGRYGEAATQHETNLKVYEAKLGPDHPDTLASRSGLANSYVLSGRTSLAIELFENNLDLYEKTLGPDHPDTLTARHNLAFVYMRTSRAAKALSMYETNLRLSEAKLGRDHPDTLTAREGVADACEALGRSSQARALYSSVLEAHTAKLGPDHPDTLSNRFSLAGACESLGLWGEAVAHHEGVLKGREATLGPDHPNSRNSRQALAFALEMQGRWPEAETLRRDNVARTRRFEKPESTRLAFEVANLGRNLLHQDRASEAEPLLREALGIQEKMNPKDSQRFVAMSLLGGALAAQSRYAEAEPLVVGGQEGLKPRAARYLEKRRIYVNETAERVVRLYKVWGKPDQARVWAEKLGLADLPADSFARP